MAISQQLLVLLRGLFTCEQSQSVQDSHYFEPQQCQMRGKLVIEQEMARYGNLKACITGKLAQAMIVCNRPF